MSGLVFFFTILHLSSCVLYISNTSQSEYLTLQALRGQLAAGGYKMRISLNGRAGRRRWSPFSLLDLHLLVFNQTQRENIDRKGFSIDEVVFHRQYDIETLHRALDMVVSITSNRGDSKHPGEYPRVL